MTTSLRNLAKRIIAAPEFQERVADLFVNAIGNALREAAGDNLYIPKKCDRNGRKLRDNEIRRLFTGNNLASLATDFNLSPRQVRNIIKKK